MTFYFTMYISSTVGIVFLIAVRLVAAAKPVIGILPSISLILLWQPVF